MHFGVFLYCPSYKKKTKFSTKSARTYAILTLNVKKTWEEKLLPSQTFFVGTGYPPPHTPPTLAPSAPRLGSRFRRSTLTPNFNSWIRLCRNHEPMPKCT